MKELIALHKAQQKIIEDMTYVETELSFDKFTGKGIKVLIGAIVFALISIFTDNSNIIQSFNLTWNQISFTCLISTSNGLIMPIICSL